MKFLTSLISFYDYILRFTIAVNYFWSIKDIFWYSGFLTYISNCRSRAGGGRRCSSRQKEGHSLIPRQNIRPQGEGPKRSAGRICDGSNECWWSAFCLLGGLRDGAVGQYGRPGRPCRQRGLWSAEKEKVCLTLLQEYLPSFREILNSVILEKNEFIFRSFFLVYILFFCLDSNFLFTSKRKRKKGGR